MMEEESNEYENKDSKTTAVRTAAGIQKMKLERLMKNPDKPVLIPERQREKRLPHVPDFVRNVMGSSAGAGSGEFHVYRHLRRKEYARQKIIYEKSEKAVLDEDYQRKLEDYKKTAEEKTAKKRAKRQKKKEKLKIKKLEKKNNTSSKENEKYVSDSDSDISDKHKEINENNDGTEKSYNKENSDCESL